MNIFRELTAGEVPVDAQIRQWVNVVLACEKATGDISLRIVNETESADLNQRYRGKAGPTNVLSFPVTVDEDMPQELAAVCAQELGDLIICAPVVQREALEQGKTAEAHWAHMLVHGVLHLLGHDHDEPDEARIMEAHEIEILQKLGYSDPYETD